MTPGLLRINLTHLLSYIDVSYSVHHPGQLSDVW